MQKCGCSCYVLEHVSGISEGRHSMSHKAYALHRLLGTMLDLLFCCMEGAAAARFAATKALQANITLPTAQHSSTCMIHAGAVSEANTLVLYTLLLDHPRAGLRLWLSCL